MTQLWGGIEAGGTKFVCAVGTGPGDIRDRTVFPTTTPGETLSRAIDFFHRAREQNQPLRGVGIASFGPLDLNPLSERCGHITNTPKPGWADTDIRGRVREGLDLPVTIDTDVNGAALGEHRWGAAQGLETFVYITVGTGIGGGAMVNGRLLHGLVHPEMGHMRVPRDPARDSFPGLCPFHGDCLEGLASGPAVAARWGRKGESLPGNHPAWDLEAHYLALGLVNLICTLSPQRIVLGGGVMKNPHLFVLIREEVKNLLNGYLDARELMDAQSGYIVPPRLGDDAGIAGALALAHTRERQD